MKRILFLTSSNLATNPRLVKELYLAVENGYCCTVLQFNLGNWSDQITEKIKKNFPSVLFVHISGLRKPFFPWFFSSILELTLRKLPNIFHNATTLSIASGKRSFLLLFALKKYKNKFDWIIAHTPATFYPAWKFSNKTGSKLGIDVEDYHPGETNDTNLQFITLRLMQIILPKAMYTTYASDLIMHKVKQDVSFVNNHQKVILNGFSLKEFKVPKKNIFGPLKLVWFSQYIDKGRGLETLLSVIEQIDDIELYLIGSRVDTFMTKFVYGKNKIFLINPIIQKDLHSLLSDFDVGLALEPGKDLNNQLAISNKIIAYAQAGLYILASKTPAQNHFLETSQLGYLQTDLNECKMRDSLQELVRQKDSIRKGRIDRYFNGRIYNWESISNQITHMWNN